MQPRVAAPPTGLLSAQVFKGQKVQSFGTSFFALSLLEGRIFIKSSRSKTVLRVRGGASDRQGVQADYRGRLAKAGQARQASHLS
jgi:hypothetical protein